MLRFNKITFSIINLISISSKYISEIFLPQTQPQMITLQVLSDNIRIFLYSFFIFCNLFFFYKLARHPRKSYDLLMILILIGPLFVSAALRLLMLLGTTHPLFPDTLRIFAKFGSYWIVWLAIYHYSILKSFQEKFSQFPFKPFILFGSAVCLSLSLATNFE